MNPHAGGCSVEWALGQQVPHDKRVLRGAYFANEAPLRFRAPVCSHINHKPHNHHPVTADSCRNRYSALLKPGGGGGGGLFRAKGHCIFGSMSLS